jgi:uncharacterized membrane protein
VCRCHEIWDLNFLELSGPLQALPIIVIIPIIIKVMKATEFNIGVHRERISPVTVTQILVGNLKDENSWKNFAQVGEK